MVRDVVEQRRKKTRDPELVGDIAAAFEGDPRKRQRTMASVKKGFKLHHVPWYFP